MLKKSKIIILNTLLLTSLKNNIHTAENKNFTDQIITFSSNIAKKSQEIITFVTQKFNNLNKDEKISLGKFACVSGLIGLFCYLYHHDKIKEKKSNEKFESQIKMAINISKQAQSKLSKIVTYKQLQDFMDNYEKHNALFLYLDQEKLSHIDSYKTAYDQISYISLLLETLEACFLRDLLLINDVEELCMLAKTKLSDCKRPEYHYLYILQKYHKALTSTQSNFITNILEYAISNLKQELYQREKINKSILVAINMPIENVNEYSNR
ncbi:hypothetical protein HYV11_01440 [Candidatus Dependentiae bacterium]|nr:hypothetical protein [Candidatus Dependentiae bacterium]